MGSVREAEKSYSGTSRKPKCTLYITEVGHNFPKPMQRVNGEDGLKAWGLHSHLWLLA